MTVLVTGCAGFIGSRLSELLLQRGEIVLGLDTFTTYYDPALKRENLETFKDYERFQFIQKDLATDDLQPILEQVECVFHTAGQPGVRGSWGDQFDEYLRNNVLATQRLLESIKKVNRNIKVVFSSSSSIYGNPEQLPTSEKALPRPYSPYGTTKLAAEHLCMLYHANYGIPAVALRYFTVYGPFQRPDMAFHIFIKALLEHTPIILLGDGSQTRDFTFVDDIVQANLLAATKPVEGDIFNIGGGSRISLREVINMLEKVTGIAPVVEIQPPTKGDVRDTSANIVKAQSLLEYDPKVTLEEGLKHQFEWEKTLYSR